MITMEKTRSELIADLSKSYREQNTLSEKTNDEIIAAWKSHGIHVGSWEWDNVKIIGELIVIQKCNDCGRFETVEELQIREGIVNGEEANWIEGQVENGLSEEEREEAREILNDAIEGFSASLDSNENEDDPNWDVCFNICPKCAEKRKREE
ncbi:MAG: hypothetical protein L6282_01870 [Candidatus Methanoperedenaceae archaeon]|nr:hypothetical protein [Candidatus Methanoperedenaceae archaeon]